MRGSRHTRVKWLCERPSRQLPYLFCPSTLRSEQLKVKMFASPPGESLHPYDSLNLHFWISRPQTVSLSDILVTRLSHIHTHAYVMVITLLFFRIFLWLSTFDFLAYLDFWFLTLTFEFLDFWHRPHGSFQAYENSGHTLVKWASEWAREWHIFFFFFWVGVLLSQDLSLSDSLITRLSLGTHTHAYVA